MNDRYPRLRYYLTTLEGFSKSIRYYSPWMVVGALCFMVSAIAALFNAGATSRGLAAAHLPDRYFWDLFFQLDGAWIVVVLAPVVLIPVGIAFLVKARLAFRSEVEAEFRKYQDGGFLATTCALGVLLKVETEEQAVVAFAHPDVPLSSVGAMASVLRERMSGGRNSPATGEWTNRLLRTELGPGWATPAQVVDPTFPANVWLTRVRPRRADLGILEGKPAPSGSRPVVLLPNAHSHARIYTLKRGVKLA
jgi:hypothetical protein